VRGPRRTAVSVLALLCAVSGALCLVGAARPLDESTPVGLLEALGCVGVLAAAGLRLADERGAVATVHTCLAALSVLVALVAARSATAVGVVGLGPVVIALSLYAAHFLRPAARRAHVALLVVATSAGAALSQPTGVVVPWAVTVVAAVCVSEVEGGLVRRLHAAASTDPLTGLANRRAWEEQTERLLRTARATGRPLTLAVLDLDAFKAVNDTHGHAAGDALLRDLAASWTPLLRGPDVLARLSGDEFALTLPSTDADEAQVLLARLHDSHATAWCSGTATSSGDDTLSDLLSRADAGLYAHKRSRRRGSGSLPEEPASAPS